MKRFIYLLKNCFRLLSDSSRGKYSERTDDVVRLRREMLNGEIGSFRTDRENMIRDKNAICGDIGKAFQSVTGIITK